MPSNRNPVLKIALGSAILLVLLLMVYSPVFRGGFIWDDDVLVTENALVKSPGGLREIWFSTKSFDYFPLTLTTFWIEWRLWGDNAGGYHVVNLLLHGIAAILLWRVLLRLNVPGAFLVAMVFAVHPVNVATAAWIAERKNTLSLVFFLISIRFYLKLDELAPDGSQQQSESRNRKYYFLSLITFVLALLSKTSVVVMPVVLLLCLWWRHNRVTRSDLKRVLPFFALSIGFGLLTIWFQKERAMQGGWYAADPFLTRLIAGSWAVWFYLFKAVVPIDLMIVYPRWDVPVSNPASYVPGAVLLAFLIFLWKQRRKAFARAVLFVMAYFIVCLGPILGAINMSYLTYSRVADHWQYLAIIGIIAGVVALGNFLLRRFPGAWKTAAGVLIVVLLASLSWQRAALFRDGESLYADNLKRNPRAWVLWNNMGVIFSHQGKPNEARDAFVTALKLRPDYPKVWSNYGVLLSRYGKQEEALQKFREGLRIVPQNPEIQNNVADVLIKLGRHNEAITHASLALQFLPEFPQAHYNLANALYLIGRLNDAAVHYAEAVRLNPDYSEARGNLGRIRLQQGRVDEAIALLAEAVRQNPNDAAIRSNFGWALARKHRFAEALEHFSAALKSDPNFIEARFHAAEALLKLGKSAEVEDQYVEILRLEPNHAEAHFQLAMLYLAQKKTPKAVEHLRAAVRIRPGWRQALNNLAWVLATSGTRTETERDEALRLARESLKLGGENADTLDTLAVVHASRREFEQALEFSQTAVRLAASAGRSTLAAEIESRIKLYRAGQPYVEDE